MAVATRSVISLHGRVVDVVAGGDSLEDVCCCVTGDGVLGVAEGTTGVWPTRRTAVEGAVGSGDAAAVDGVVASCCSARGRRSDRASTLASGPAWMGRGRPGQGARPPVSTRPALSIEAPAAGMERRIVSRVRADQTDVAE